MFMICSLFIPSFTYFRILKMKYFLIAGEASGDLHGANLIKAIKQKDAAALFQFWGGDLMAAQAPGLAVHYKNTSIMGLVEVLMKLRTILSNIKKCKEQILVFKPDVVVLIDYPGFNLRIAEFCKKNQIKVAYYIAPKVWAWKENRAKKLEQFVDELLLIFPFETDYFKKWKVNATYVGNPLLDEIHQFKSDEHFISKNQLSAKPIIALLPGSRKQEIEKILPLMMQIAASYKEYQFVVAGAPSIEADFYKQFLEHNSKIVFTQTYDLLSRSTAAIVCSGTATLEAALFNVPQVCGYVANAITYAIGRPFVKVKYISLVNLILDKPSITELIQKDFNLTKLQEEFEQILPHGARHTQLISDYNELKRILGKEGASDRAAEKITTLTFTS